MRFDAAEREMKANGFVEHPEAARAIKLLHGCKISTGIQMIMTASTNQYKSDMFRSALQIHYSENNTITGHQRSSTGKGSGPGRDYRGQRPEGQRGYFASAHSPHAGRDRWRSSAAPQGWQQRTKKTFQAWITERDNGRIEAHHDDDTGFLDHEGDD